MADYKYEAETIRIMELSSAIKVINLWRKTHRLACGMKALFPTFFCIN